MHIHKPDDALLLLGHASRFGRPQLTVTVGYVCEPGGKRVSESDAWQWLMSLFPDEPFDLGEKKAGGGFGVAGDACAPAGAAVEGLTVRAGVGALQSRVLVQGDRRWMSTATGWRASAAQAFQRQPIGLAYAYGGPDWRDNPYGRGHGSVDTAEGRLLPNVEHPEHPVLSPSDTPVVATLGVQPMGSSGRDRWLGAVDDAWIRNRLPWLPDDTDPHWFDRFPPQQCQPGYWRGDEPWFVENMHPRHAVLQGRLPALRPRLLLRTVAEPDRHVELTPDLDTVWLMPNDERVVVLYRAQLQVLREDAKDVQALAVFTENLNEPPQPLSHWSAVWLKEQEEERDVALEVPAPLSPDALAELEAIEAAAAADAEAFETSLNQEVEAALQSATTDAEDQLRAKGFNLEAVKAQAAKADTADFKGNTSWAADMPSDPRAFEASLQAQIEGAISAAEAESRAFLTKKGFDVDALIAQGNKNAGMDPDLAALTQHATALLPTAESESAAHLAAAQQFEQEMGALEAQLQAQFDVADQAYVAALADLSKGQRADIVDLPTGPRVVLTRASLLERVAKGESAAWTELEGLDLAGVDLAGLDLRQAVLRQCDLRAAVLAGANLTEAELVNCILAEADLNAANLTRAQLEACDMSRVRAAKATFSEALVTRCVFEAADLGGSVWDGAEVSDSRYDAATLVKASGHRARFAQCSMAAVDATESRYEHAEFEQCTLDGARFTRATLGGSTLQACQAPHAQFDHAQLQGLRTLSETRLDQSNLTSADLQDASLQNTSLAQAILREACLDRALVKECDLTGTDAWRVVARQADFADSHIGQASWRGANLMQATFGYARLLDIDFTGANLHAAQTRTATVQGLVLTGALLTRCRLLQEYGERGHG